MALSELRATRNGERMLRCQCELADETMLNTSRGPNDLRNAIVITVAGASPADRAKRLGWVYGSEIAG